MAILVCNIFAITYEIGKSPTSGFWPRVSSDGGMLRSAGKRVWAKDTLILLDQIDNHLALCKSGWFEGMDKIMVWLSYLYTKYVLISIYLFPIYGKHLLPRWYSQTW